MENKLNNNKKARTPFVLLRKLLSELCLVTLVCLNQLPTWLRQNRSFFLRTAFFNIRARTKSYTSWINTENSKQTKKKKFAAIVIYIFSYILFFYFFVYNNFFVDKINFKWAIITNITSESCTKKENNKWKQSRQK